MYRSVIAALLLVLGGCAGAIGVAASEAVSVVGKARAVGVISAVGSKFALQKVGITVFGNELNEVPIASWGPDDVEASRVSAVLGKRFAVKRISVPQGAFAAYENPAPFSNTDETLQGIVRRLAASQPCDLYVVVTRSSVPFGGTNQVVTGVGWSSTVAPSTPTMSCFMR